MSMPLHSVLSAIKSCKKFFLNKHEHVEHTIKELVNYAEVARRDQPMRNTGVASRLGAPRRGDSPPLLLK